MAGKKGQTIGYHYMMTVYSGIARAIDELVEIRAEEGQVWVGSATDSTPQKVNKPDLFGGEKREGGIQGAFRLFKGEADQVLPGDVTVTGIGATGPVQTTTIKDLRSLINQPISQMRGFASVIFDGLVTSMSPYPKPWAKRIRRLTSGWHGSVWYPEKVRITLQGDGVYNDDAISYVPQIHAMNPAHIIYKMLTDPVSGAGTPVEGIDENSFIAAANRLCCENFGLCFLWTRQEDVQSFIQIIVDHIGAVLYQDRETGKYVLRLIRDDYNIDDLPHYTVSSGLLRIEDEEDASFDEALNEIVIKGHDPVSNEPFEVRVHDQGGFRESGEIKSDTIEYKGIPTRHLALRVGMRELRAQASGLKRMRLFFDRRAWRIAPGMPIRISWPTKGIDNMVIRLGEIDYGAIDRGEIMAIGVEDIFSLPATTFSKPVEGGWNPPSRQAVPPAATRLVEAGYRDLFLRVGNTGMGDADDTSAYIGQLALSANTSNNQYDLLSKTSGETNYTASSDKPFTGAALLAADVAPLDTVLPVSDIRGVDADNIGQALLIGDEIVELVDIDFDAGTFTVRRGCGDTIPAPHGEGEYIWTIDDDLASDEREYAVGEDVMTKVLSRTASDLLNPAEVGFDIVTLVGRHALPYPPGNVTVDGVAVFDAVGTYPEPVFDWSHRDRLVQQDQLVAFEDGSVGPEAGTEYRLRFYSVPGDTLLRTETVSGTTFTYDATMQGDDGTPDIVRVVLDSQRDGLDSYQRYDFIVRLRGGYGFNYGRDYGGVA